MHQIRNNLKSARGLVVVKNIVGLIFVWALLLLVSTQIDYYSKAKGLGENNRYFITNGETVEEPIGQDNHICNVASLVFRLLNCPNIETIEADNKKALSYMTEAMAKRTSGYLEWRVDGIKRFRELNKTAKAYLLEDMKTEIIKREDLPKIINKSLLNEGGRYVLVEGRMKAFDDINGKEIHSKSVRELVHLLRVKQTIDKPSPWLVDAVVSLD